MAQEQSLKKLNQELEADRTHAQILIQIANSSNTFEEAKKVIEGLGVRIIEVRFLSPNWILLKLGVRDMREAALKLTERGLYIKGINALP